LQRFVRGRCHGGGGSGGLIVFKRNGFFAGGFVWYGGVGGKQGDALAQFEEVFEGPLIVSDEAGFVAEEQREGGLFGELREGDGDAAAFADRVELRADSGSHFVHFDVEHFVLHGPAALLEKDAAGHALDLIGLRAVAGSEAG
jgi:hypothetical protein